MAFAWAESITAGVTVVKKAHVDEMRTNIDHVRTTHVGLLAYSWAEALVQNVTPVKSSHWVELRTAIDQADTANVCSVDNVTQNASHLDTNYVTNNAAQNTSHLHSYNLTVQAANYGSDNPSNLSGANAAYWTSNMANHHPSQ